MIAPLLSSVAAFLLAISVAFQVGLAIGAPWGSVAYGGRAVAGDGTLPWRYRLGSALAALALLGAMWVVLAAGAVIDRGPVPMRFVTAALWALVALFALNTFANASGRHPVERWGAGSVTAILTVLCALLAIA